jgi:hypothetical protein
MPARLLRFRPADWPGERSAAIAAWLDARRTWIVARADRRCSVIDEHRFVVAVYRGLWSPEEGRAPEQPVSLRDLRGDRVVPNPRRSS